MRRPLAQPRKVQHHTVEDRPLISIGPDLDVWEATAGAAPQGAIVWIKPPPNVEPGRLVRLIARLKERGCHVKVLPPDRVDDVVTTERVERAPVLQLKDTREVVYQLVRELAGPAGVSIEDGIRQVNQAMDGAGI